MLLIKCPHCNINIEIIEINCAIFRCGITKEGYNQLPPHSDKKLCDYYIYNDLIYGCGKPFKIVNNKPLKCGYI